MRRHDRVDAIAIAIVTLLCALWGVQQAAVKVAASQGLPPLFQAAMRSIGAAVLLLGWIALTGGARAARDLLRRDAVTGPGLVIAAAFAVEFLALFPGLHLTTASRGVVFLYTAPFFTAIGVHLFVPGERMRPAQAAGLLIAFGGVAIAFAQGLLAGGGNLLGDALCLLGGLAWGGTTVYVKATPRLAEARPEKVLFLQLAGSAPILLAVAAAFGEVRIPQATPLAWACLLYQTAVVAFVSYLVWFRLVLNYPAGRLAGFTFLTPIFGILAGALLLGESMTPALLIGLAAIIAGMWLLNRRAPMRVPATAR